MDKAVSKNMTIEREFAYSNQDFELLRKLVKEHTGINLSEHKQEMLYSRLARRLRALKMNSFASYYKMLKRNPGDELIQFVNAVTTNLTAFFREPHHFQFLEKKLLPELIARKSYSRRLRIWSAGCASGEEPYSLAMVLKENMPIDWDIKILATDLDSSMVERGKQGVYTLDRIEGISNTRIKRWFKRGSGIHEGKVQVVPELQSMITFKTLNLMHNWPMHGPIDIIFCRNVVIYFDKPTQRVLFDRFANLMDKNGCLFVGHSENLFQLSTRYQLLQQTVYRRIV
ncbi:protein-glutamate O-methyltransferase [Candidatus Albibeggiatoa sp. nov. NOAA]|uniref:CheR family methyltransferase n=1 Tax=Candidatus Albibeggiatoa sp. nov. NOAA TaxID=3162724 RepID=UPI0032F77E8C|nr:protein-glutamate O-methyltransferase [Thiotrichaceae bacterium]